MAGRARRGRRHGVRRHGYLHPHRRRHPSSEPDVADAADPPYPFDLPPIEQLRAGDTKVYAHYFPLYPISLDNAPRTRTTTPPSSSPPTARAASTSPTAVPAPAGTAPPSTDADWALDDMRTEVERAP
ncbi:MAG: hypothetical protein R2743_22535 [Ilumatobacteraceae bacterium]